MKMFLLFAYFSSQKDFYDYTFLSVIINISFEINIFTSASKFIGKRDHW